MGLQWQIPKLLCKVKETRHNSLPPLLHGAPDMAKLHGAKQFIGSLGSGQVSCDLQKRGWKCVPCGSSLSRVWCGGSCSLQQELNELFTLLVLELNPLHSKCCVLQATVNGVLTAVKHGFFPQCLMEPLVFVENTSKKIKRDHRLQITQ